MKPCLFFRDKKKLRDAASSFMFADTIRSQSLGKMHARFVFALSVVALLSCVVSAADDITAQIRADMETAMIAQAERGFPYVLKFLFKETF